MRAPANPLASPLGRLASFFVALMLAATLAGAAAVADEPAGASGAHVGAADAIDHPSAPGSAGAAGDDGAAAGDPGEPSTLAGYLAGEMLRVSADVALVAEGEEVEPVVGSFTVDGLTYAVTGDGEAALVAASPRTLAAGLAGASSDDSASSEAEGPRGAEDDGGPAALAIPASVEHDGISYAVASVGPRALAGCDAAAVTLPTSASSVDQTAFQGSAVAAVEVASGNPAYSSHDGMLFDAGMTRLLLIPEGKQGAALVPDPAREVILSGLSHSAGEEPSPADGGGAAFTSRNGRLYDASGSTLLWAPPGSEEAVSSDADVCEDDGLPAASLGEAVASRGDNNLTLNGGGGTIYKSSNSKLGTLTKKSDPATISCGCNKMKVRMLPGYPGAIHYRHGTSEDIHLYYLWIKAGYKVTGFRDVANPGDDFTLTETLQPMAGKARTLEPTWSPQSYTITMDGGSGGYLVDGTIRVLSDTIPITYREGLRVSDILTAGSYEAHHPTKRLAGWQLQVNGSIASDGTTVPGAGYMHYARDALFSSSDAIDIAVARGQSVKLVALWEDPVSVTLHSNAGGGAQIRLSDGSTVESKTWSSVDNWGLERQNVWLAFLNQGGTLEATVDERWGYEFLGWATSPDATAANLESGVSNLEAWAVWRQLPQVTIHANGHALSWERYERADESGAVSVTDGSTLGGDDSVTALQDRYYGLDTGVLTVDEVLPTRWLQFRGAESGWQVIGFSKGSPSGAPGAAGFHYDTADVYAIWEPIMCTLTFDKRGGQGGTDSVSVQQGERPSDIEAPWRGGYRFSGYATAEGTTCFDASGRATGAWASGTGAVLYAQWEPYDVTVHANGHSLGWVRYERADEASASFIAGQGEVDGGSSKTVRAAHRYYNADTDFLTVDEVIPTSWLHFWGAEEGWRLVGFSKGSPSAAPAPGGFHSEAVELYAIWEAAPTSLIAHANLNGEALLRLESGEMVDAYTWNGVTGWGIEGPGSRGGIWAELNGGEGQLLATMGSRVGYHFLGWSRNRFATEGEVFQNSTGFLEIYGVWKAMESLVSFDANGGEGGQAEDVMATWAQPMPAISATPPARAGYTFMGWYDDPDYEKAGNKGIYYRADGSSARPWNKGEGSATLYAGWKANTYTVQYWSKDGRTKISEDAGFVCHVERKLAGKPTTGVTPGYRATGWEFRFSSGTKIAYAFGQSVANLTYRQDYICKLHLVEEPMAYSVSFDANGGKGGQSAKVTATFAAPMPAISATKPVRTGYTFMGWYNVRNYAASGAKQYYTAAGASALNWDKAGDAILYAGWRANEYNVNFNANGGEGGQKEGVKAAYGSPMPSISATKPIRAGYTFMGWYDAKNFEAAGAKQYYTAEGASSRSWDKIGGAILYAGWKAASYTVSFDANGGKGGQSAKVTATFAAPMPAISVTKPVREGYAFMGWYSTRDYTAQGAKRYYSDACAGILNWDQARDATLFAGWRAGEYEVSFDANGGSGGQSEAVTATYDSAMPAISATNPARPGYAFEGWWDAATGGTRYYTAEGAGERAWDKASDATLYARWRAIGYAISYDCAGGELPEGARASYTIGDAFDLPAPARYGYQFDGWEVAGAQGAGVETVTGADGSKVTRVKVGTYGDLSCTARWTLRYDLDAPVCDPGSVTFEADSLTGQVRVAPGTSADGAILSYMAVPVALDSVSCEGLGASGEADPAGGAPELEAIFGAGSVAKVRFTVTVGEGDASQTARLTAGGPSSSASLADLSVPAATSHADPGRVKVSYGLELDPGLAIPPVRDAAPVARLAYTVSLPPAGA